MVLLGTKAPKLILAAATANSLISSLNKEGFKNTVDKSLVLLKEAKKRKILSDPELQKCNKLEMIEGKFVKQAKKFVSKLLKHATDRNCPYSLFAVKSILSKAGVDNKILDSVFNLMESSDEKVRGKACKRVKNALKAKANSLANIKIIAEEISDLNKKPGVKILGVEKLLKNIDRFEKQVEVLLVSLRERLNSSSKPPAQQSEKKLLSDKNELSVDKPKPKVLDFKVSAHSENKSAAMQKLVSSVDFIQETKELLIEIAAVCQEIDFLKSKLKPFEKVDPEIRERLLELEKNEKELRGRLRYNIALPSIFSPH